MTGDATGPHCHFEVWRDRERDLGTTAASAGVNAAWRLASQLTHPGALAPVLGRRLPAPPCAGILWRSCENGHDVPRPREDLGPRR